MHCKRIVLESHSKPLQLQTAKTELCYSSCMLQYNNVIQAKKIILNVKRVILKNATLFLLFRKTSLLLNNLFVILSAVLVLASRACRSFEMIILSQVFAGVNAGTCASTHSAAPHIDICKLIYRTRTSTV